MLSDLQIMNKWASVLTGYKSTGERIFEFARAIEAEVRKDYEALIRDAIDRVEPEPPAQKARMPLSDEQIFKAYTTATGKKLLKQGPARPGLLQIFRLAEAAHGIGITAAQKETPCAPTPSP